MPLSTASMPESAAAMMLLIRSPLPDSEAVKVSKLRSVFLIAS